MHTNASIAPLRRPTHEFRFEGVRVEHSLLCPEEGDSVCRCFATNEPHWLIRAPDVSHYVV
jgi:hypothetical protein